MWQEEYFEIMWGKNITSQDTARATALKNKNLPKKIYKYRAINQYSLSNLLSDTVWICSPNSYNDPYDCCCTYDIIQLVSDTSHLDFDKFLELSQINNHISVESIDAARRSRDPIRHILNTLDTESTLPSAAQVELRALMNKVILASGAKMIRDMNSFFRDNMRICSFSERNDSLTMWGHYASSHKGICIEYDFTQLSFRDPRKTALTPVRYDDVLFDVTSHIKAFHADNKNFNNFYAIMAAAHKSKDWEYEREWRLIFPFGGDSPDQNYPMPKPSAVYMGARISADDEVKIREICAYRKIPLKRMSMSHKKFKLEFQDVPLGQ